jgi:pimeloyl-ACP methyl ester carboxylesterase
MVHAMADPMTRRVHTLQLLLPGIGVAGTSLRWATLMICALLASATAAAAPPPTGSVHLVPTEFVDGDGRRRDAEEGWLFVPENRQRPGSRTIAIHFLRVEAGDAAGVPVVYLPGGPGTAVTRESFKDARRRDLTLMLRAGRTVLYVNQRGNPRTPGAAPMLLTYPPSPGRAVSADDVSALRQALQGSLDRWAARDVDTSAYDILQASDDVADLARALGHDRIILAGGSFGSQWALALLRRHPGLVDRALLFGVEPLDHAYDSPADVWRVYERLDAAVQADPLLGPHMAGRHLTDIARDLVEALHASPREVEIQRPDGTRSIQSITAADLRKALITPVPGSSPRENLAAWPKFVLELHHGDFRRLAALATAGHAAPPPSPLIFHLIDHSVGTSAARDGRLLQEARTVPLGDLNSSYRAVRGLLPTRPIDDAFRKGRIRSPVLVAHGDMDVSTPIENMADLSDDLAAGRTLRVEGGTHEILGDLMAELPEVADGILRFLACPDAGRSACSGVPEGVVRLPPLDFNAPVTSSLANAAGH